MAGELRDGDVGWKGVHTLTPGLLAAGELASGKNVTLEFGDIRERWGVMSPPWGNTGSTAAPIALCSYKDPEQHEYLVLLSAGWRTDGGHGRCWKIQSGTPAEEIPMNGFDVWPGARMRQQRGTLILARQGNARYYWTHTAATAPIASATVARASNVATITTASAHGLQTGDVVSLSGFTGGPPDHAAFNAAAAVVSRVDATTFTYANSGGDLTEAADTAGTITMVGLSLNNAAGLYTGDKVEASFPEGGQLNPLTSVGYWVSVSGNAVKFHPTKAHALADTNVIELTGTSAGTRLCITKVEAAAAAGQTQQTAALPLLLESVKPGSTVVASWDYGWHSARTGVSAHNDAVSDEFVSSVTSGGATTGGQHGFIPGQAVKWTGVIAPFDTATTYYVCPLDEHRFTIHASQEAALTGDSPMNFDMSNTGTLMPAGYSALPMPGGDELGGVGNRLVVATRDRIGISDPGDFLHFTPYTGAKTANLGEAGGIRAVVSLSEDVLLLLKEDAVLGVFNTSGAESSWALRDVTREYGCGAALSAVQVGSDCWFLSVNGRGVASIRQTEDGKLKGTALPMSEPIQQKLLEVDWSRASQAAGAWYNNRYLLAVPTVGQTGTIKNDLVLVYNFLRGGWDGWWQGDSLDVVQFARHVVAGRQRLCFVSADGVVRFFDETAMTDMGAAIDTEWTSRGYMAGYTGLKQWQKLVLVLTTWQPQFTVEAILDGVNNSTTLAENTTLSRTKSFRLATAQAAGSNARGAEDYAVLAGDAVLPDDELLGGRLQTVVKTYPLEQLRSRLLQVRVRSSLGVVRCAGVFVDASGEEPLPRIQPA